MAFNGGIIDKAELASDMYANDTAYTDSSMANVVGYLDEMLNGVTGGGTDEPEEPENVETFSNIYTETKSYTDSEGKTADKTAEQINEDSSSWGNYSDYNTKNEYEVGNPEYVAEAGTGVLPAGSSEYWKANNIYDLAGNAYDWTQEASYTLHPRPYCSWWRFRTVPVRMVRLRTVTTAFPTIPTATFRLVQPCM